MKSFSRNASDNDMVLVGNGVDSSTGKTRIDFSLSSGLDGVAAVVDAITKTELGEDQLDTTLGIPYLESCLADTDKIFFWKDSLKKAVEGCSYVSSVEPISVYRNRAEETLRYEMTVNTTEGEADVGGSLVKQVVSYPDDELQNAKDNAGKPIYTVTFKLADNSTVCTKYCISGQNVVAPDVTDKIHGYTSSYAQSEYEITQDCTIVANANVDKTVASQFTISRPANSTGSYSFTVRAKRISNSAISRVYWGDYDSYGNENYTEVSTDGLYISLTHTYNSDSAVVTIDDNFSAFYIGDSDFDYDSKSMVTGFSQWGESITSAYKSFCLCSNLSQSVIPAWPEGVTNVSLCYEGCVKLAVPSGSVGSSCIIPKWPSTCKEVYMCYCGCTGIKGAWTDNMTELMPSQITSYEYCVTNASAELRALFSPSYGGTRADATVTVTLDYYTGSEHQSTTQQVTFPDAVTLPDNFTRTAYTSKGWDKELSHISEDTTITAKYEYNGLCFTATSPLQSVTLEQVGTPTSISLEYSTDGSTWSTYTIGSGIGLNNTGDRVWFKATTSNSTFSNSTSNYYRFVCNKTEVSGNIMSLLSSDLTATSVPSHAFYSLFYNNEYMTIGTGSDNSVSLTLPATSISESCYYGMFEGCASITVPPALPASTMAQSCYEEMFYGCSSLASAPTLSSDALAVRCYMAMFMSCTSLTTPPALRATNLADHCYCEMFAGCVSLTSLPTLKATTLVNSCYKGMFDGCVSITETTFNWMLATTFATDSCAYMFMNCSNLSKLYVAFSRWPEESTDQWLSGVASNGYFCSRGGRAYNIKDDSGSYIPAGWGYVTVLPDE